MQQKNPNQYPIHDYYSRIYRQYDLINRIFTFGRDQRWRQEAVKKCLADNPKNVLDLCCGTGDLALRIRSVSDEKVHVTGYDFNRKMLEMAELKAEKLKLGNLRFECGDVASLPFSDAEFDCISIGFGFRNLTFENPNAVKHLSEMNRVLRQGGRLVIIESSVPDNSLIRIFYKIYLRLVLVPLGGILSGDWKAYKYLAHSSSNYYSPAEVEKMLKDHGLKIIFYKQYILGCANLVIAIKL
jgi:demethylmenaquinone methyltransferase / 2-methoxy-6-polyprenyl-1,4-benzoquinol methylase